MKIREGFISNSSSSSFVCITKPGKIDEMLKNEDTLTQKVVKYYLNSRRSENIKFDGKTYCLWHFNISTEEFGCKLKKNEYDIAYDKWNDFIEKLGEEKDCVIRNWC